MPEEAKQLLIEWAMMARDRDNRMLPSPPG